MNIKFCDRDDYLQLLKEEAEAAEPKPADAVEEVDDSNLAAEIAALREELQNAVTLLRSDLASCILASEQSLSSVPVPHGEVKEQ